VASPPAGRAGFAAAAARLRVPLHFLLAVLLLVFARPTGRLLFAGAALVAVGLAVRAWAAGHLRRDQPLTTSGPYAYVRHPLYLGSTLVLAGFAVAGGRAWMGVMVAAYFVFFFLPVMRREGQERQARAPGLYPEYARRVPALMPYRGRYANAGGTAFDWQLFRSNREGRAALGCAALLLLLYFRMRGVF